MNHKKLRVRKERIQKLNHALKKMFPNPTTELVYKTPWQFVVAAELSAQCTDKQVNKVTRDLFKKYRTLSDYVNANPKEFERYIHSCTYSFQKTRNILAAAKMLKEEFGGKLPNTIAELTKLPGVGRKTANVILNELHNKAEGVVVDTHMIRFVRRFSLSDHRDPKRIERDLMALLPKKEWADFSHRVIHYGRYIAPARRYDTSKDPLVLIYPRAATQFKVD